MAEEHGKGDAFGAHPCVGFGEHVFDETAAAEMMGDADLCDAANAEVASGDGDGFVVERGVGDQLAGRSEDEPAVSRDFADVPAGEEDGLIGKTGEEEMAEIVVFRSGDFRVTAVDDGKWGRSIGHGEAQDVYRVSCGQ